MLARETHEEWLDRLGQEATQSFIEALQYDWLGDARAARQSLYSAICWAISFAGQGSDGQPIDWKMHDRLCRQLDRLAHLRQLVRP